MDYKISISSYTAPIVSGRHFLARQTNEGDDVLLGADYRLEISSRP